MTTSQLVALASGLTALLVAAGHFLADVTGLMDRIRRTPRQRPPAAP